MALPNSLLHPSSLPETVGDNADESVAATTYLTTTGLSAPPSSLPEIVGDNANESVGDATSTSTEFRSLLKITHEDKPPLDSDSNSDYCNDSVDLSKAFVLTKLTTKFDQDPGGRNQPPKKSIAVDDMAYKVSSHRCDLLPPLVEPETNFRYLQALVFSDSELDQEGEFMTPS